MCGWHEPPPTSKQGRGARTSSFMNTSLLRRSHTRTVLSMPPVYTLSLASANATDVTWYSSANVWMHPFTRMSHNCHNPAHPHSHTHTSVVAHARTFGSGQRRASGREAGGRKDGFLRAQKGLLRRF